MAKKPWLLLFFLVLGSGVTPLPESTAPPSPPETSRAWDRPLPPAAQARASQGQPLTREIEIRRLFMEKNYDEALSLIEDEVKRLDTARGDANYRDWLGRQKWILKTAQAWLLLEKQNCPGAMAIISEIPGDKVPELAFKGIGYCKLMAREWQEADVALSRYVKSQNHDHEALQLLARAKESQGLYEEALDLTNSLASIPMDKADTINLEPLKKSLLAKQDEHSRQLTLESGAFRIYYQPNLSLDFVEKVVETMNQTAAKLNADFGIDYPAQTIDIYFHSQEHFGEITHGPDWAAGIYDGQIRLPIGEEGRWSEEIERSIRHELAHALLAETVSRRNLPTWFQEGFAQIAECQSLCLRYTYAATTQKFFPIKKFDESFMSMQTREAQVAYKQSLYMMLYLLRHEPNANIRQMFSLISGLDSLNSKDIIEQSSWSFSELHEAAADSWNKQLSL